MHPTTKLTISILLDLLGFVSYFSGGLIDIIYAPLYGLWIRYAYKDTKLAWLGFAEELLPFTDAIPTATIAHFRERNKSDLKV